MAQVGNFTALLRARTATCALAVGLMIGNTGAMAQDAPADDAATESEIVVTGSRIARPDLEAAAPVSVVSNDLLLASGNTTAGDIIQYAPALFGSISSDLSATRGTLVGGTQLDLRNLGPERTLVLVNGRRHVAGSSGTAVVDVDTIPSVLIERVDVLTGGASAVYGSDAVSGVVNYVLKPNFTGIELDGQFGISERGDADRYYFSGAWGIDLGGRGNMVISGQYRNEKSISYGDRSYLRGGQRLDDDANPALRIQQGELTPELAAAGAVVGDRILSFDDVAPQALIDRARAAAPRAFLPRRAFSISSPMGLIGFAANGDLLQGPFRAPDIGDPADPDDDDPGNPNEDLNTDFDGNGINDCSQTVNFALSNYGCYTIDRVTGRIRPFRDGLIAGFANQFGGDGILAFIDSEDILPQIEQFNINWNINYEVSSAFKPFLETKFVRTDAAVTNNVNSFNDTIPIRLDNPFIPPELLSAINDYYVANPTLDPADGTVFISRDNTDFGRNRDKIRRDTFRIVAGADGDIAQNWKYQFSLNFGQTKERFTTINRRLEDRFYAAVDAVRAPNGDIVCRSSLDPTQIPGTSPFPAYDADPDGDGIFEPDTFRTNDGTCRPLNLFGLGSPSDAAVAFVNPQSVQRTTLREFVMQGYVSGTTEGWFSLPGGAPGIVAGAEYRRESSAFIPDPLDVAGLFYESGTQSETGNYHVWEVFGELDLPILKDVPFAETLNLHGSARYSKYNLDNVGGVFTWGVDGSWAPVSDIRFRASYNKAIRAPNITELFGPITPATFRPIDVCDEDQINLGPNPAVRLANCRADGIPVGYTDPLTGRITGLTGGNPDLEEERSTSWTVGGVLQPRWIPGFSVTVDYWNYEITNAIQAVDDDDIVAGCYDSVDFPNNGFCSLFTRSRVNGEAGGFNSFRSGSVNFAFFKTDGVDFQASYSRTIDANWSVKARIAGTWLNNYERFTSVTDPSASDDFVGEAQVPEWAFNTGLTVIYDRFSIGWESFWQSAQFYQGVEVEDGDAGFARPNRAPAYWSHDLNFGFDFNERFTFRAGVNNLTDKRPYPSEAAYPLSARGRSYFVGVNAKF